MTQAQRQWLDAAQRKGGGFLCAFATACFAADDKNFELLSPALEKMMAKYPRYSEGI